MAVKTQGSQLYFVTEDSGGKTIHKVACATNLSGLSAPREQIETTCMDGDGREYESGLGTPGQVTVTINFDPAEESHMALYEMWASGAGNTDFVIGYGGPKDVNPTLDSDGETLNFPTTRHFLHFEGYVVDVPHEGGLNSVWTSDVPIQISGPYTLIPKA